MFDKLLCDWYLFFQTIHVVKYFKGHTNVKTDFEIHIYLFLYNCRACGGKVYAAHAHITTGRAHTSSHQITHCHAHTSQRPHELKRRWETGKTWRRLTSFSSIFTRGLSSHDKMAVGLLEKERVMLQEVHPRANMAATVMLL